MKHSTLLLLAAVALLASCATPRERRLAHNPEMFAKLSESEKHDVQVGRVHEGMSRDAVYLAWGRPTSISVGKREGKAMERWRYQAYQAVVGDAYGFGAGFGGGYWGRHGYYYDPYFYAAPSVAYVPVDGGRWVEFVNGKVESFMAPVRR